MDSEQWLMSYGIFCMLLAYPLHFLLLGLGFGLVGGGLISLLLGFRLSMNTEKPKSLKEES